MKKYLLTLVALLGFCSIYAKEYSLPISLKSNNAVFSLGKYLKTNMLQQAPVVVDNLAVKAADCPKPSDIKVTKNAQGQIEISWTPVGNETQWELVIQPQDTGTPSATTQVITVTGTPSYIFADAVEQVLYEAYVRAYCSATDKSLWEGPEYFSDFDPPACAKLDVEPLDFSLNEAGEYIICRGDNVEIPLRAMFDNQNFKSTTSYSVESIEYAPPFPFTGGHQMDVSIDDTWSPTFNLPFDVCFYGNRFSTVKVGSNGVVKFGSVDGACPWDMNDLSSFPDPSFDAKIRNVIMGVYQDINPSINVAGITTNKSVNYQVLGIYPCRTLVINFNDILQFSCEEYTGVQTSQIVIYEITNIIEVYVKRRVPCTTWNGGKGAIGLINANGTQATIPPGRNVGNWSAENEAWRFTPNGEAAVDFTWYANGVEIGNTPEMNYTINEPTTFEGVITYPGCGGENLELRKKFKVNISEEIILPNKIDDIVVCLQDKANTKVDITSVSDEIMANIANPDAYNLSYHLSEADANSGQNSIQSPNQFTPSTYPQTIYARVTHQATNCYEIISYRIVEGEKATMPQPEDVVICMLYELPKLPDTKFSYSQVKSFDMNTGSLIETMENLPEGHLLPLGKYEITVKMISKDNCESFLTYNVEIIGCDLPKGISPNNDGLNDNLDLTYYKAISLKIYNRYGKEVYSHGKGYTNQWYGQDKNGNDLPDGTYFIDLETPFERFNQWIQLNREIK